MKLLVTVRVPERFLVKINIRNMTFVKKHCLLTGTPLFSVLTDIKYRAFVTCSTTPLYGKLPLQILESSAVASTVWSHEKLPWEHAQRYFIIDM